MPTNLAALLPLAAIAAYAFNWYLCFRRNIQKAKESGLPYVVVPTFSLSRFWLITSPIWLWLARRCLSRESLESWYDYSTVDLSWDLGHKGFKRLGTDTFLAVSGGTFCLWTADADVAFEMTTRRNDFPKPGHMYRAVNIYGKNVVSADGHEWRRHRKIISPTFGERNNHLVWSETLDQTQKMLDSWIGRGAKSNKTIDRIMDDTMRLSLNVISRAEFGRKLDWPEEEATSSATSAEAEDTTSKIQNLEADRSDGHNMSFVFALHSLLGNLLMVLLFPQWLLKWSPFKKMRRSNQAYSEWGDYMREMVASRRSALQDGRGLDEIDIMGQLIKGQVTSPDEKSSSEDEALSDSEIYGNAFVLIVAGHETVATSLHFSIVLLALNIAPQRHLQRDLESHFQGRPVSTWNYDQDLPALFGGMAAAVMNEELRLVPPVVNVPKSTYGVGDQPLTVNGKLCTVPANTYINIAVASIHRNPRWWPNAMTTDQAQPDDQIDNASNDLCDFKPERWLVGGTDRSHKVGSKYDGGTTGSFISQPNENASDEQDVDTSANVDPSPSLYHPPRGAFIPFSEGARACIGRRFGQIEILVVLAIIFTQYSVELAVDKYASDEEVDKMDAQARKQVWQKAADDAHALIQSSTTSITLQMKQGHVPVRFVRKGEERFDFR